MKVKINNIDEFCAALKAGYTLKDKYGSSMCVVKNGINIFGTTIDITFGDIYYEKPDPLKIECGKYYKTRDGRKACVVFYEEDKKAPFRGLVSREDRTKYWTENGISWFGSEYDLVSEWKED